MLNIGGLKNGVVIDHIQAGRAMKIYEFLFTVDTAVNTFYRIGQFKLMRKF